VEYTIKLTFATQAGGNVVINVPTANASATSEEIRNAMQRILDTQIVAAAAGEPYAISSAELVTTETEDFEL
jgi:hypothetical protein